MLIGHLFKDIVERFGRIDPSSGRRRRRRRRRIGSSQPPAERTREQPSDRESR